MVSLFLKYLKVEKHASAHTILAYQTDLAQFSAYLLHTFDEKQPENAKPLFIRSWIADLMDQKLEPRSVNRKIASLGSFYKYMIRLNVLSISPMLKVKKLKTDKPLPNYVEEKAMSALLNDLVFENSLSGHRDRLVLELLYGCGFRLAELLSLKPVDFDLSLSQIKVLGKGRKERIVPMGAALKQAYADYQMVAEVPLNEVLIRTDKGLPAYPVQIQRMVKNYLSGVTSIAKKSPHVLRHSFATHLLNHGAELKAIKDLLGHSSLAATQIYTHNSIEKLKNIHKTAHPKGQKT